MKKPWIFILPIVLVGIIAGLLIFIFSGDVLSVEYPIEGTWKVLSFVQGGEKREFENTYYVFDDAKFTRYDNNEQKESGTYNLKFDVLSMENYQDDYYLKKLTENIISFEIKNFELGNGYYYFLRVENMEPATINPELLLGDWTVTCHAGGIENLNEKLVFDANKVDFYRNDMSKPAATSQYAFEGKEINVPSLGIVMKPQLLTDKYFVFIEKSNSLVWELMRA